MAIIDDVPATLEAALDAFHTSVGKLEDEVDRVREQASQAATASIRAQRRRLRGASVAFTGAGLHSPDDRRRLAALFGFGYQTQVTGTTSMVVLGAADTETAQVARAREAGLPMVTEAAFWRRLGHERSAST